MKTRVSASLYVKSLCLSILCLLLMVNIGFAQQSGDTYANKYKRLPMQSGAPDKAFLAEILTKIRQGLPEARLHYAEWVDYASLDKQTRTELAKERIDLLSSQRLTQKQRNDAIRQFKYLTKTDVQRKYLLTLAGQGKTLTEENQDALLALGRWMGNSNLRPIRVKPNPSETRLLEKLLKSSTSEHRKCAVETIEASKMREFKKKLQEMRYKDKSKDVRLAIKEALFWIDAIRDMKGKQG